MEHFGSLMVIAIIVVGGGLMIWKRSRRQAIVTSAPVMSQKALAQNAFIQGNTYLEEGEFAKATAAFQQALELDPAHPHVGGRLAEVARRQPAALASEPATP